MDSLLPPLHHCMIELQAPPELNANTKDSPVQDNVVVREPSLQNTGLFPPPEAEEKPICIVETLIANVADKDSFQDNYEHQEQVDVASMLNTSFESASELAGVGDMKEEIEEDVEESVRQTLDCILDQISDNGQELRKFLQPDDAILEHLSESDYVSADDEEDHDKEQLKLRDCFVLVDRKVVSRYLHNMRRRKRRQAQRMEASKEHEELASSELARTRRPREASQNTVRSSLPIMTRFVCKECHESFLEPRALRTHFRGKHIDVLDDLISVCGKICQYIVCPLCNERFRTKVDFNSHMGALHRISRWVFEGMDSYDQQLLGDIVAEQLRKKMNIPKVVDDSKVSYKTDESKIIELPEHQAFKCNLCDRKFNSKRGVANHTKAKHPNEHDSAGRPTTSTAFVLPTMPLSSRRRSSVTSEVRPILPPKPPTPAPVKFKQLKIATPASTSSSFVCEWCRDRLKTLDQLHTHLRSKHSVPENFSAEGCNLPDFYTAMEHHFEVEEKEENCYECVSCKETFLEKVGLLEHFSGEHLKSKVIGMQIKLQCGICGHEDSDVRNLHDHMWNEHANQKLEDMVIRVKDVRSVHRCGEECKLLWKKPVVSVEGAPRPQKRQSSVVEAVPRAAKSRRLEKPANLPSVDDEEAMRKIEEEEEQNLRDQEEKAKNKQRYLLKKKQIEDKKQKLKDQKALYYAKKKLEKLNGIAVDSRIVEGSALRSQGFVEKTLDSSIIPPGFKRCFLCLLPCADMKKHIAEAHHHSSMEQVGKSKSTRAKPPVPEQRSLSTRPSFPPKQHSPLSASKSLPQVVRCPSCKVQFPDIIAMMKHKEHCSAAKPPRTSSVARKHTAPIQNRPSVITNTAVVSQAASKKKGGQFVLMEDEVQVPQGDQLECHSCNTKYDSMESWEKHMKEAHFGSFICELCHYSFKDENSLCKHIARTHKIMYPCMVCHMEFTNKKYFLQHVVQQHQIAKTLFSAINLANVSQVKHIFANLGYHDGSSSQSMPADESLLRSRLAEPLEPTHANPFEPEIKLENVDMPVMYQCELCESCFNSPEDIKQHMQFVH